MPAINYFEDLIKALQCLPNVGKKSAQRIAFQLLAHSREDAGKLAQSLTLALANLQHCAKCQNFTNEHLCKICADTTRNPELLCIVETPMDLLAIEQTHKFNGLYFVLMGAISPITALGTKEIGLNILHQRIFTNLPITEILLATNFTNEGEATAFAVSELVAGKNIKVSRLAHGVPVGGELEYLDVGTVAQALIYRQKY